MMYYTYVATLSAYLLCNDSFALNMSSSYAEAMYYG